MRSGPSSQPQTGRVAKAPHAAANAGSKRRRENGQPVLRLTPQNAVNTPSTAQMYADDVRGSPSCTGVGVVKLGREGRRFRGVTPELRQYPSSAAGFRRRALFFEFAATRQIRAPTTNSGHLAFARLSLRFGSGPYVSGTMGTGDRNNPAYGISCRTRPIPIVGTRPDRFETGTAWAV